MGCGTSSADQTALLSAVPAPSGVASVKQQQHTHRSRPASAVASVRAHGSSDAANNALLASTGALNDGAASPPNATAAGAATPLRRNGSGLDSRTDADSAVSQQGQGSSTSQKRLTAGGASDAGAQRPALSRQPSADSEVNGVNAAAQPAARPRSILFAGGSNNTTTTVERRRSFGGGGVLHSELDWRNPRAASEIIAAHLGEDPNCFRDHVAIYWRLENMPAASLLSVAPEGKSTPVKLHAPLAERPSGSRQSSASRLVLHASSGGKDGQQGGLYPSPAPSPFNPASSSAAQSSPSPAGASVSASAAASPARVLPPSTAPETVSLFLSLGPSTGVGDKIGSSESRPAESSVSFHPMLLPHNSLHGNEGAFSVQVQVWSRRTGGASPAGSQQLVGYVDVAVSNLFASFQAGQGLLLKPVPPSASGGSRPVDLPADCMIVVDYIQFYCNTTQATVCVPCKWPSELAGSGSDCLWRSQIHAIKLVVPRGGCPHPNVGGSMSPAVGALMMALKDSSPSSGATHGIGAAPGVCFFQIFQFVPAAAAAAAATQADGAVAPTSSWSLVHTSEFLPLSRNPKFSEFQRPLADICSGGYDLPLMFQVACSHDAVRVGALATAMPEGMYADPALALAAAIRAQGNHLCAVAQAVSSMREVLAGKAKLKLHAPGAAPFPSSMDESFSAMGGGLNGGGTEEPAQPLAGHGTLAFNISQIFSSRASLETLARAKLQEFAPAGDGFDEAGVVRSTAYLASLLPLGRRAHHRPGSHIRGPSAMGGGGGEFHSPSHHHHAHHADHSSPHQTRERPKTSTADHRPSSFNLHATSSTTNILAGQSSNGMSSLLDKMGLVDPTAPVSARVSLEKKGISPSSAQRRSM